VADNQHDGESCQPGHARHPPPLLLLLQLLPHPARHDDCTTIHDEPAHQHHLPIAARSAFQPPTQHPPHRR